MTKERNSNLVIDAARIVLRLRHEDNTEAMDNLEAELYYYDKACEGEPSKAEDDIDEVVQNALKYGLSE